MSTFHFETLRICMLLEQRVALLVELKTKAMCVSQIVLVELCFLLEAHVAGVTLEWAVPCVSADMVFDVRQFIESPFAVLEFAFVVHLASVRLWIVNLLSFEQITCDVFRFNSFSPLSLGSQVEVRKRHGL